MFYTEEREEKILKSGLGSGLHMCHPGDLAHISRRQLLKGGANLCAFLSGASLFGPRLQAQTVQKRLVWIMMGGGWDILEITDPKVASTAGIDMTYDYGLAHEVGSSGERIGRWLPRVAGLGNELLVVRGLSMGTTSHTAGAVYMDTGILSNSGQVNVASIPAIIASQSGATIPLIQLQGGMDVLTDRATTNVSVVRAQNLELYRSMYPASDVELAQKLRILDHLQNSVADLGQISGTNDRLTAVETAETKIRGQFQNNVREKLELSSSDIAPYATGGPQNMNQNVRDSFAMAAKLIKNDLVSSVNMGIGGFDTHANQEQRMQGIVEVFDFLLATFVDDLRNSGFLDSTIIAVISDFGRTPKVNNSNGRDHWPVGGALLLGGGIDGGRVVGATDDDLRSLPINTTTGLSDSSGELISAKHLGGSVVDLCLGNSFFTEKRAGYLFSIPALTRLRS